MGADLQAIYVETSYKPDTKESEQLNKNINLARQLGVKFRIITNRDMVKAIVDFAQKENITHIIIGKPTHPEPLYPLKAWQHREPAYPLQRKYRCLYFRF